MLKLKISAKLPIVIVVLSILSLAVTAVVAFNKTEAALEESAFQTVDSAHDGRIGQLTDYINFVKEDLSVLATNHMVIDGIKDLEDSFADLGTRAAQRIYIDENPNPAGEKHKLMSATDGSLYSAMHAKYHPWFRRLMESRDYYDVFLINEFGDVVYSVYKEADYATNVKNGKWKDSDLGKVFRMVEENQSTEGYVAFTDFAPYAPSANAPASFMAVPVFEYEGNFHGAVVFQMSISNINRIMQVATGMGETGSTFLVGADGLMRSDSRFTKEGETDILKTDANSEGVKKAFATGEDGLLVTTDRYGNEVLLAYIPLDFMGVRWALIAKIDMEEVDIPTIEMRNFMLIAALIIAIVVTLIGVLFARSISKPIANMTTSMGILADGDLQAEIPSQGRADEIGEMAAAVQVFKENAIRVKKMEAEAEEQKKRAEEEKRQMMLAMADDFEASVGGVVQSVSSAATEMQSSAQSLSATADQTSKQSTAVAAASEEASTNVQTVASAAEELSSSIGEISRQVSQSTQMANTAVAEVQSANAKVQGLADAANKIGEVVALITDIADQTNLLALNATIEAARAGEAGKGFAVVASEVKNLANQTAKATEEISAQIGSIQGATSEAVEAIGSIESVIGQLNEVSSAIAAAVEEQGAATSEIARNVEQASAGTAEVSSNITSVTQAADETGQSAGDMLSAASELSQQSETLRSEVDKFLAQIRAG